MCRKAPLCERMIPLLDNTKNEHVFVRAYMKPDKKTLYLKVTRLPMNVSIHKLPLSQRGDEYCIDCF